MSGLLTSTDANFVSTSPGAMALTRILALPSSTASVLVIEMTAALVMPYTPCSGAALMPSMLATLTMLPGLSAFSSALATWRACSK